MSSIATRLRSNFLATTRRRADASGPVPCGVSGRNKAADITVPAPTVCPSRSATRSRSASRSAGGTVESSENSSITSIGTSGPMCSSIQR